MKKFCSLFLTVLVVLLCFSGCKGNSQKTNSEETQNTPQNSVEKIYDDFLKGKSTAVYGDGTNIDVDYLKEMASSCSLSYGLFDRNGDSVPELCINNELYVTTFWVQDGTLKLWHEENYFSKILSNGNCLEEHHGGAPNHSDYSYIMYSYSGDVVSIVTLSVLTKNDIDVPQDIYTQTVHIHNGNPQEAAETIEISKEQFDKTLSSIEAIGEANISWKTIE